MCQQALHTYCRQSICGCAGSNTFGATRGWTLKPGDDEQYPGVPYQNYCIGVGRAEVGRRELFNALSGIAVTMTQRVFSIPSCAGAFLQLEVGVGIVSSGDALNTSGLSVHVLLLSQYVN